MGRPLLDTNRNAQKRLTTTTAYGIYKILTKMQKSLIYTASRQLNPPDGFVEADRDTVSSVHDLANRSRTHLSKLKLLIVIQQEHQDVPGVRK